MIHTIEEIVVGLLKGIYTGAQADRLIRRHMQLAIETALEGLMAEWQPIETAPKDGTQMLLTNGTSVAQGWWEHQEPYIREKRDMEGNYIDQDEHDGYDGWLDCEGGMQPDPTHWMPLPKPPISGGTNHG